MRWQKGYRHPGGIALTSGGAIPEVADYRMVLEPDDTFIGTLNETPIGIIKTSVEGDAASIYAFGVLPAYRGRGFGRQILAQTVERLLAEHREPIAIEVETDNCNALGLYESCGFRATTTFGYYELPLPWVPSLDSSDAPAR